MQSLAKPMEDAVRAQGGAVQGFTGDGIMAVFGAPVAHEDAPLRACRAALAILEWLNVGGAISKPGMGYGRNFGSASTRVPPSSAKCTAALMAERRSWATPSTSLRACKP